MRDPPLENTKTCAQWRVKSPNVTGNRRSRSASVLPALWPRQIWAVDARRKPHLLYPCDPSLTTHGQHGSGLRTAASERILEAPCVHGHEWSQCLCIWEEDSLLESSLSPHQTMLNSSQRILRLFLCAVLIIETKTCLFIFMLFVITVCFIFMMSLTLPSHQDLFESACRFMSWLLSL